MKNLALSLGGGAARGAFHLGILHYFEENKIEIKAYSGASIGAIISVAHASGISAKEQLKIFASKDVKDAIRFNYFKFGVFKIDIEHKIIKELIPIKKLEDLPKPVYVNAYDINSRKLHYFNSGNSILLALGSSALVPMFRPIKYQNMNLIDGGLFDNLPIKPLEKKNYKIFSVDLFPKDKLGEKQNFSIKSLFKKAFLKQLYINKKYSIENSDFYIGNPKINDYSLFTFDKLEECFSLGYKEAVRYFTF